MIEAAGQLFHERGYHAVGVSEICSRAEVQKGSFYHVFASKQKLALAVIQRYLETAGEAAAIGLAGEGSPLDRLERYFASLHERQVGQCADGARVLGCPLGNLALELATWDEELREALRRGFDRQVADLELVLREARRAGEIEADVDIGAAARALVALLEGHLLFAKLSNDAAPLADLAPAARRVLGLSA
jgi:TetR/AcrR family transcriptional repressor of nem operon